MHEAVYCIIIICFYKVIRHFSIKLLKNTKKSILLELLKKVFEKYYLMIQQILSATSFIHACDKRKVDYNHLKFTNYYVVIEVHSSLF
jgi:hypothetical protein